MKYTLEGINCRLEDAEESMIYWRAIQGNGKHPSRTGKQKKKFKYKDKLRHLLDNIKKKKKNLHYMGPRRKQKRGRKFT